jgi:4-amino-4-deoxychorismate lyase
MEPAHVLVNSVYGASINSADRGLLYGHGLFETMRLFDGQIPLWPLHLERLIEGASRLHIPLDGGRVQADCQQLIRHMPEDTGILKVIVTAGAGSRGYASPVNQKPTVVVQFFPVPASTEFPVAVQLCRYRLSNNPALAGIKHLNRLDQVMAASELNVGEYGLLLDVNDHVIEGVSHNLFALIDGQWQTPLLDQAGVAGVMRRYLMETLIPLCGVDVKERAMTLPELLAAEEVFFCNSLVGIMPIAELAGLGIWKKWPYVEHLRKRLVELHPCYDV